MNGFTVLPNSMVADLRQIVEGYAEGKEDVLEFEGAIEAHKGYLHRLNEILVRPGSKMHLDVGDEEDEDITVINPKRPD